jgi:hypothetical protein
MLNRLLTYLSRMFLPHLYTPEGFRLTQRKYVAPENTAILPANEKRTITICNLFSNQNKSIDEIANLLDTNRRTVVSALIHEGLVLDRRDDSERNPKLERRQTAKYHLPRVIAIGETDEFRALCGQISSDTVSEFVFDKVLKKEERCEDCRKRREQRKD